MAYIFNINQTPPNGAFAMYSLVATMISGGWTQVGSGDATTFSNAGAGPVIGGHVGIGGLGNNQSWVRLQMPLVTNAGLSSKREIIIQRGGADTNWWIRYSCSGSFIGTGNGTISATVTPTAADGINVYGGGSAGSQLFDSNGIYRANVAVQNVAPYGFVLWAFNFAGSTANNNSRAIFLLDPITQAHPLDPDPYTTYADTGADLLLNVYSAGSGRFYVDGTANFLACYSTITSSANYKNCNTAIYYPGFQTNILTPTDPFNPGVDVTLPILYYRRPNTAAPVGPKGFSTIMAYVPNRRSVGYLLSLGATGANSRFCIGDVCLPWSGVPSLV